MDYIQRSNKWLESNVIDEKTKENIRKMSDKELEDAFYKDLEFGTAGLRRIIADGANRMNKYTVAIPTQAIANYIKQNNLEDRGVVISYDSRIKSEEFAKQTAAILVKNNIKTYLFENLRPVPELSYAVRQLNTSFGIMITASHNPPEYNGYKVYYEDGAQISSPIDEQITQITKQISFEDIDFEDFENIKQNPLLTIIGKEMDDKYLKVLKDLVINKDEIEKAKSTLKIVYTPFHGTGNTLVERLLSELGFENVLVVPEQKDPDGNFPTVDYPNPEDDKAFELALKYANEIDADIILANDPDADRLGVWAKNKDGKYIPFTGNQSALIIAQYRIDNLNKKGQLPKNGMLIESIVSSNMARAIAKKYNLEMIETLTGFKNICKVIRQRTDLKYVFGFEESYGCLIDDYARDKDGISAVMTLCEVASYYKNRGKTLFDALYEMFEIYGTYKEKTVSIVKKGSQGAKQIEDILQNLRNTQIEKIGPKKVISYMDILNDIKYENGIQTSTNLPKSNVLYYELEDDCFCCIRPSGTEPKMRIYIGVKAIDDISASNLLDEIYDFLVNLLGEN